jgi:methyl-accepting chemotaxis protein
MLSISNIKIGRKIGVVLGGVVVLLVGLAGFALWGTTANERMAESTIQRLTKERLASTVDGDTSAIAKLLAGMVIEKKVPAETLSELLEIRKSRAAALGEFRKMADTPTSIKHGEDMAALVEAMIASNEKVMTDLSAGRYADAGKNFRAASRISSDLHATANEALQFQQGKFIQNEKDRKATSTTVWTSLIVGSLLALAGSVFGGIVLTRQIANPLGIAAVHFGEIAKGDLSKDAPAEFKARGDEIGTMARAKQAMIDALRSMIQEIAGGIHTLSESSTELMASSGQMTSGAKHASDKAHSVSAAAEEMSSNITSVAAGMEQTTTNLANVASSTEQMTSTIGEIAQNSEKARRITDAATKQAARITEQINHLGAAAREIGKVTETITEISSQTNLLALNATIEAARAGSAGKGFAVVATEIKALAQQTAAATEDIKARIEGVQSATAGGISEIGKISQVIEEVSAIVASIAAAIEEQSAATKDIARNIAEAAAGVNDSNTRVSETSVVSREIAKDIVGVDHAAGEMASGSDHVRSSASELSAVAEALRVTVSRFHA